MRSLWLGWAGTAGDASMQYMITDAITTPALSYAEQYYSERFVLMPRVYQVRRPE